MYPPSTATAARAGSWTWSSTPDFATNRLVYLSYGKPSADGSSGTTTVVRGRLEGGRLVGVEEIFESQAWDENNNHFSGRLVFNHSGYLFLTVGDRLAAPDLLAEHPAQDLASHHGTIIRLHDDGRVPADNPFVGRDDALPRDLELGTQEHAGARAPPAHPGSCGRTSTDPAAATELNLILPGKNYGWPVVSHGINYDGTVYSREPHREGVESPRYVWVPSIATSGLMIYTGDAFPWWRGSVFVGGLVGEQLARLTLVGSEVESVEPLLEGTLGRIRDVRQGPDGYIYLAIGDRNNPPQLSPVVRLEPVESDIAPPR